MLMFSFTGSLTAGSSSENSSAFDDVLFKLEVTK